MDASNIVRLFNDAELDMNLTDAFELADRIVNDFQPEMNRQAKVEYDLGRARGRDEGAQEVRNQGVTLDRGELIKLRGMEDFVTNMITEAVPEIIERVGRNFKIMCIKTLREKFPFLSIKQAKDFIDTGLNKIIEDEKRMLREATQRAYSYSSYDYDDSYDYGCGPNCSICG